MTKLLIDYNEKAMAPGLISKIEKKGIEYELCNLETGDFIWDTDPQIVIERKQIGDFCKSLFNHHIHSQALRMQEMTPYNYIVIIGPVEKLLFDPQLRKRFKIAHFIGGQARLGIMGAKMMYVNSQKQFVDLLVKLLEKYNTKDRELLLEKDFVVKGKEVNDLMKLLMTVNGVSFEKAKKIKEKYQTLREVIEGLKREDFDVYGIGPALKKNLKGVFQYD